MSGEHVVGSVSWSPDFESKPDNDIQKALDEGRIKIEPHFQGGKLVSFDLVRGDPEHTEPTAEQDGPDIRPHKEVSATRLLDSTVASLGVSFSYKNWKGDTSRRRAVLSGLSWGMSRWHTKPQFLIDGYDLDKKAPRTYAVKDITDLRPL